MKEATREEEGEDDARAGGGEVRLQNPARGELLP